MDCVSNELFIVFGAGCGVLGFAFGAGLMWLAVDKARRRPPAQMRIYTDPPLSTTQPDIPTHPAATVRDADPHGKTASEPGAKLDAGKPRMSMVLHDFNHALVEVSKVGTFGANKYSDHGWLSVPNGLERYTDALYRHLLAEPERFCDKETDLPHAAHAAWNALARLQLMLTEKKA